MSDIEQTVTLAVVAARLEDLRQTVDGFRDDVVAQRQYIVTRGEWMMRNEHVDSRFREQGRELGDLRTELRSRRAPWWSTAAVLLAAVSLAWSILGPLLRAA